MVKTCDRCSAEFDDEVHLTACPHIIVSDPCPPSVASIPTYECVSDLIREELEILIQEEMVQNTPYWRLLGES